MRSGKFFPPDDWINFGELQRMTPGFFLPRIWNSAIDNWLVIHIGRTASPTLLSLDGHVGLWIGEGVVKILSELSFDDFIGRFADMQKNLIGFEGYNYIRRYSDDK